MSIESFHKDQICYENKIISEWKNTNYEQTNITFCNKKFITFPYPYMNGFLHIGHGMTCIKIDFYSRFYKMIGYDVLEPFSFHFTGMPIPTSALKIKREKDQETKPQTTIMKMMNIPDDEIDNFIDPYYWCQYFPKFAKDTLNKLGIFYDSSRSFQTTEFNPIYDAFVKWQFHKLKIKEHLKFGKRYDIYSIKDGQACLGHDRSDGEDAIPEKFNLIKLNIHETNIFILAEIQDPRFLPDMTNIWIDPNYEYTKYKIDDYYLIMKEYNLKSLAYQNDTYMEIYKNPNLQSEKIIGNELLRSLIDFDNKLLPIVSFNYETYNKKLKMNNKKSTSIICSIPTINPAHYLAFKLNASIDTIEKLESNITFKNGEKIYKKIAIELFQEKKKIIKNSFEIISEKDIDLISKFISKCEIIDSDKFDLNNYEILEYYEPNKFCKSRSGDELIVANLDQWYLDYGNEQWKQKAKEQLKVMDIDEQTRKVFEFSIEWLDSWACSRTFGLGSKFPKEFDTDEKFIIDSLSDSTIYMALYTVYHHLSKLPFEEITDKLFDYIFLLIESEDMSKYEYIQKEFIHWYPVDVRVSAKDLCQNHLTMSIFNHVAIWDDNFHDRLNKMYPDKKDRFGIKSYKINGYIMMENKKKKKEKMSKSKGNFKTLQEAIELYTSDSIRMTLANCNESMDDALFDQKITNRTIIDINTEQKKISKYVSLINDDNTKNDCINDIDILFKNISLLIVNDIINCYENMKYASVISHWYKLRNLRDEYTRIDFNKNILKDIVLFSIHMISPILCYHAKHVIDNIKDYDKLINESQIFGYDKIIIENIKMPNEEMKFIYEYLSNLISKIKSFVKKRSINEISIKISSKENSFYNTTVKILKDKPLEKLQKCEIDKYYDGNVKEYIRYYKLIESYYFKHDNMIDYYEKIDEHDILKKYYEYICLKSNIEFDIIYDDKCNKFQPEIIDIE